MTEWQSIGLAAGIVAGDWFVSRRLLNMNQNLKLRLIEDIERLAADPRMPKADRDALSVIPGLLFGPRAASAIVILVPSFAVRDLVLRALCRPATARPGAGAPAELKREVERKIRRSALCIVATSPAALSIAAVLAPVMAIFLFVPFDRAARAAIRTVGGRSEHLRLAE